MFITKSAAKSSVAMLCCLLFLCSLGLLAFSQTPPKISSIDAQRFHSAMAAMDRGDTAQAETLLQALHANHPRSFAINESLGLLYAAQGRMKEALPLFQSAVQEQPSSDVAHSNLGAAYSKLERNEDALRELGQAVRLNPANAGAQQSLGEVLMRLGAPAKAAHAFTLALRQNPHDSGLLFDNGVALYESGQMLQAREMIARMQGVEASAAAQSLYGDIEEKLGHYQEAVQHYSNAVRLEPSEANAFMLGAELLRHWTFDPAIVEFKDAVVRFPESTRMHLGLGVAYYGAGRYDDAIVVFSDLLKGSPENVMYAELMGRTCTVLVEISNPRCTALINFARRHPENALVSTFAATQVLHNLDSSTQNELARTLLQAAIAADPKLPQAQYQMGVLLQAELHWPESIPFLEAAIRLKPDYAEAHYRLARAYYQSGRKEEARVQLALQQKYSKQAKQDRDAKLEQITTFIVSMQASDSSH